MHKEIKKLIEFKKVLDRITADFEVIIVYWGLHNAIVSNHYVSCMILLLVMLKANKDIYLCIKIIS